MPAISKTVTIGNGHKKMIFKGTKCFQFPEAVVFLQRKKANALPYVVHYKFSLGVVTARNTYNKLQQQR